MAISLLKDHVRSYDKDENSAQENLIDTYYIIYLKIFEVSAIFLF